MSGPANGEAEPLACRLVGERTFVDPEYAAVGRYQGGHDLEDDVGIVEHDPSMPQPGSASRVDPGDTGHHVEVENSLATAARVVAGQA